MLQKRMGVTGIVNTLIRLPCSVLQTRSRVSVNAKIKSD